MPTKPKKDETLEEKLERVVSKAQRKADLLASFLTGAQQEAGAKVKAKAVELLDAADELLGDDE